MLIEEKLKSAPSKIKPPKNILRTCMWAYYAPDGYIQVRSLAHSRSLCREMICIREWNGDKKITYKDYENAGYYIRKVVVDIVVRFQK